jgi:hypothetical protein
MTNAGTSLFSEKGLALSPGGYSSSPLSYYLSEAGILNNGARYTSKTKTHYAAVPLNVNLFVHKIKGSAITLYPNLAEDFARFYTSSTFSYGLGHDRFKSVLVANKNIKSKIESSPYIWKKWNVVTVGVASQIGFLSASGNEIIQSHIEGDYSVLVVPSGLAGVWGEGSPESVLLSAWSSEKITNEYSATDVEGIVKDFYKDFYRYELTSTELASILAGE